CFNVVDSTGAEKFSLFVQNARSSYRAFHFPSLPPGFTTPQIDCKDSAGVTFLYAPQGYTSYKWSTGDTTRRIAVTGTADYDFFAGLNAGGFIRSEIAHVVDQTNFC